MYSLLVNTFTISLVFIDLRPVYVEDECLGLLLHFVSLFRFLTFELLSPLTLT